MKQLIKYFIWLICFPSLLWRGAVGVAFAQNVVLNYSFEDTIPILSNPNYYDPESARHWFSEWLNDQTPDYYSEAYLSCCPSVPSNAFGYQYARTGVAYTGAGLYWNGDPTAREYFAGHLAAPLEAGHTYFCRFYVSLADNVKYAVDRIGMYFSVDTPNFSLGIPYIPQIENPSGNIIIDTMNWVPIQGYYTALGGEQIITLGNFRNNANTQVQTNTYGTLMGNYYFFDDVSITDSTVGIEELQGEQLKLGVYPNPASKRINISLNARGVFIKQAEVINNLGQTVLKKEVNKKTDDAISIDVSNLAKGAYAVKLTTKTQVLAREFLKE